MLLTTTLEIIELLKTKNIATRSEDFHPVSCGRAYRFKGTFESGENFDIVVEDKIEILEPKAAIQANMNAQYGPASQFRDFLKLKVGEKYTLVMMGDFGFAFSTQFQISLL